MRPVSQRVGTTEGIPADSSHRDPALDFWDSLVDCQDDAYRLIEALTRYVAQIVGEASVLTAVTDNGRSLTPLGVFHADREVRELMQETLASAPYRVGEGVAGAVAATGKPAVLNGRGPTITQRLTLPQSDRFVDRYPIKALMIVPLVARGELIGTLGVARIASDVEYSQADLRTLESLAERAAIALSTTRSRPRTLSAAEYEAIFEHSMDGVLFTAPDGRVFAANPAACDILQLSEAAICELGRSGLVVGSDPRSVAAVEQRKKALHVRAEVPMRRGTGEIFIADVSSAIFTNSAGEHLSVVIFRDVTEQVIKREQIAHDAEHYSRAATTDDLTGLPNRRGFTIAAERAIAYADRKSVPIQLIYFDVDNLKPINDRLGHSTGDQVLKAIGTAIASSVREIDSAARLGGDEFAILLFDASGAEAAVVVDRVRRAVSNSRAIPPTSFSVGITERPAGHTSSLRELLDEADWRMYQDKSVRRMSRADRVTDSPPASLQ